MEYSEAALQKVVEDRLLIDRVDRWLFDEIRNYLGQRVLEVGCGMGNFARYLLDRELYVGTDVLVDNVAYVEERFAENTNVRAMVCDVTSAAFRDFAALDLDTVFSLNVFEHIDDHERALGNVVHVLRPGGTFILVVPAHEWLYGSIDQAIGHYRRYEKRMMAKFLAGGGLEPVTMKYINAAGALGWFVNCRVRKQETPPAGQLRLMNQVVPWLQRFERFVPVPFGVSLLAVARKGTAS